jgi:hypothetical protein
MPRHAPGKGRIRAEMANHNRTTDMGNAILQA